jgi:hypothetical protein
MDQLKIAVLDAHLKNRAENMIMPTKAQNIDKMQGAQDGGFNMGLSLAKGGAGI